MHNSSKSLHFSNSVLALFDQYFSLPWWTIGTLNFITLWPSCHPLCLYFWGIVVSYLRLETSQICLHIFHFCEKLRYVRVLFGWPQFLDQRQTHRIHHEIPSFFKPPFSIYKFYQAKVAKIHHPLSPKTRALKPRRNGATRCFLGIQTRRPIPTWREAWVWVMVGRGVPWGFWGVPYTQPPWKYILI